MSRSRVLACSLCALFFLSACSSLGTRDQCRADTDCKEDRVCTSDGLCADPVRCEDGKVVAEKRLCSREVREPDACTLGCDGATDAAVSTPLDARVECEGGSCADASATSAFCTSSVSCYESAFSDTCPGDAWTMGGTPFTCESTTGAPFLHYEAATWNKTPPDALVGPSLSLASATRVTFEITHRFNPDKAAGMRGMIVLFAEGTDPRNGFVLRRWDAPLSQTSSVSEEGFVNVADLPLELRENARISLLAGGAENLWLVTPMSWDIARIALRAE